MTEMVSDPVYQVVLQTGVPEEQKWQSVQLEMSKAPQLQEKRKTSRAMQK